MSIADNVARIRERIVAAAARAGRRADEITLVAVSKTFSAECIREAYDAGVRHFGENRVQEWESKAAELNDLRDATWHLVGHLQSNKARRAGELFTTIDSVDSVALAQRLDRIVAQSRAAAKPAPADVEAGLQTGPKPSSEPPALPAKQTHPSSQTQNMNTEAQREQREQRSQRKLPILIEVRLAPEDTKHGLEPADLPAVVEAVRPLPHLDLRGLMCIPPFCENPEDARPYFRRLRQFRDGLITSGAPQPCATPDAAQGKAAPLRELSMGMSHDFEVAVEEGATQIRLGTAIFGVREHQ